MQKQNLRTCKEGHQYVKSSTCPTCPVCENERKTKDGFLSLLSAPARRALEQNGIKTVIQLSDFTEAEILDFHGIGKATIPILRKLLLENNATFKN